jgi:outer membrane receptor protein involved in Fe transport
MRYGLLAGSGGKTLPLSGTYDVVDLFNETIVPIVSDKPFIKQLNLELGARTSNYSNSGRVNSWKATAVYKPYDDLLIRVGKQRAVRGASIYELYSTPTVLLDYYTDPCAGTSPTATAAQCLLTGVTADQYGNVDKSTAGQYNYLSSGNEDLKPETGNTVTLGAVYTPSYLKGLSVSVDYFDIKIDDKIGTIGVSTIIDNCIKTGDDYYCSKIHRDSEGSLYISDDGYVENGYLNTGGLKTNGLDVQINYLHRLPNNFGKMSYSYVGTYLIGLSNKATVDADWVDCTGYFDSSCGTPNPEYRHKFTAKWATPWNADISATWRYYGSVKDFYLTQGYEVDAEKIKAYNYIDLYATVEVNKNATFNIGVNNVFDKDPPIVVADGTNGNTYPSVYDPLGRYIFMGVKLKY